MLFIKSFWVWHCLIITQETFGLHKAGKECRHRRWDRGSSKGGKERRRGGVEWNKEVAKEGGGGFQRGKDWGMNGRIEMNRGGASVHRLSQMSQQNTKRQSLKVKKWWESFYIKINFEPLVPCFFSQGTTETQTCFFSFFLISYYYFIFFYKNVILTGINTQNLHDLWVHSSTNKFTNRGI